MQLLDLVFLAEARPENTVALSLILYFICQGKERGRFTPGDFCGFQSLYASLEVEQNLFFFFF